VSVTNVPEGVVTIEPEMLEPVLGVLPVVEPEEDRHQND
jgi:hypothetical protein